MARASASAQVRTAAPADLLASVCEQFEARADKGVRVERTAREGKLDFGWGACLIVTGDGVLDLRVEADDQAGLDQLCEVVDRHLHGAGDEPVFPRSATAGRDRMRGFHARARHGLHPS